MATSKRELTDELKRSEAEAIAALRNLPAESWEAGRYENGWNARQILAHLAAIEWTYPRLVDLAKPRESSGGDGAQSSPPTGGMDGYNARQVEKRANASVDQLIEEFQRNRAATIAAVEASDEALFDVEVRSAGGRVGTLAQVFREIAVGHVAEHVRDITGS